MKNHETRNREPNNIGLKAFAFAASVQLLAGPAFAGEREDALALCRQAISETYQVSADEAGAHFRDSTTSARAYTMRFDVQAKDGAASQLLTCKVKRGALVIAELSPQGPKSSDRTDLSGAAGSAQPLSQ